MGITTAIQVFLMVAETGSFTATAERLDLSRPKVTRMQSNNRSNIAKNSNLTACCLNLVKSKKIRLITKIRCNASFMELIMLLRL